MTEREKKEILDKLKIMTPFLQLEFLEKKLRETSTFDVKRFIHLKLAETYSEKKMFAEAARNMENAADIAITSKEKREDYMKSLELFIKAGDFEKTEIIMNKALACGNEAEKKDMKALRKKFLVEQGERFELNGKNNNALKIYEMIFKISDDEGKKQ